MITVGRFQIILNIRFLKIRTREVEYQIFTLSRKFNNLSLFWDMDSSSPSKDMIFVILGKVIFQFNEGRGAHQVKIVGSSDFSLKLKD